MQPKIETTDKSIFLLFKDNLGVLNFVDEILKEGSPEFQYIVPLCMTHDNHFVGTSVLKKILTARPEWIDATDDKKNTALMIAIKNQNLDGFDELVKYGPNFKKKNSFDENVLDLAVSCRSNPRIQALLIDMLFDHAKFSQAEKGKALLSAIIEYQNLGAVQSLIRHKAPLEYKKRNLLAVSCDRLYETNEHHEEIIKTILEHPDISKVINKGWDFEGSFGTFGWTYFTPLHTAAGSSNNFVLQKLIDLGARVNPSEYDDTPPSPLMAAAHHANLEGIEILLKNGAWPDGNDIEYKNALHYLVSCDREFESEKEDKECLMSCAELLIKSGTTVVDPDDEEEDYQVNDLIDTAKKYGRQYFADLFLREKIAYRKKELAKGIAPQNTRQSPSKTKM